MSLSLYAFRIGFWVHLMMGGIVGVGSSRCCCFSRPSSVPFRFNFPPLPHRRLDYFRFRIATAAAAARPSSASTTDSAFLREGRKKNMNKEDPTNTIEGEQEEEMPKNMHGGMEYRRTLESMTVKELRAMMRHAGIPAKGSKQDLVSALVASSLSTVGENEVSAREEAMSKVAPSKRKVRGSSREDPLDTPTESSRAKQGKTLGMSRSVDDNNSNHDSEHIEKATKRSHISRKGSKTVKETVQSVSSEPWTVLTHKKPQSGWIAYNPKAMRPPPLSGDVKSLKLLSWNVNGLRALLKSEASCVLQLAQKENFDVLCLQETKLQEKDVVNIKERLIDGYDNNFWMCSISKLGYSGTAIISRIKPISVKYGLGITDHDNEGRLVTIEFDKFYLLNGYVPNSGDGLRRLEYRVNEWDLSLSNYMKDLEKSKPVILTGDLNCAHEEIDIYNPSGNRRSAGFTDEERKSFERNFLSLGFVDTFRKQNPSVVAYTYFGYRHGGRKTNKGWRLDYFLVSESLADKVHDSYILPDVSGSDHCPIGLILKH